MSDSITKKVIAMSQTDTEKIKLEKHEEAALEKALSGMISKMLNKIAVRFSIPAVLIASIASGAASYAGNPDAATKDDVKTLNETMKEGFSNADSERTELRTRLASMEKEAIRLSLELDNLIGNFDEYKRTHEDK